MNRADKVLRKYVFGSWIFVYVLLVNLKVGSSATSHLSKRSIYSEPRKAIPGPEKNYTGIRVKPDSLLLLYYHEQTLAIVETDMSRLLYNCELLEVRTKADKEAALNSLKHVVPAQVRIAFDDMMDLMDECNKLNGLGSPFNGYMRGEGRGAPLREARQFISLFSGMFPGTKWCGPGDHASSYHDLGPERQIDKCCRHHDLCPVKVAGLRTQYNITNYAIYTRSHCRCDENFYSCLKSVDSIVSGILGRLYFNVSPVLCIQDSLEKSQKELTSLRLRF